MTDENQTQNSGFYVDGSDSGDYSGDSSGTELSTDKELATDSGGTKPTCTKWIVNRVTQNRGKNQFKVSYDSDQNTKSTSSSSESHATEES